MYLLASSKQLFDLATRWTAAWGGNNSTDWVALYTPKATYIDHAFQIRRTGSDILRRHWDNWRTAIPDFTMEMEGFYVPLKEGGGDAADKAETVMFSVRTVNKGTFVKDLPIKKASGRKFIFRGVVDFRVNRAGLIETIEEWYSWDFGEGKDVTEFHSLPINL